MLPLLTRDWPGCQAAVSVGADGNTGAAARFPRLRSGGGLPGAHQSVLDHVAIGTRTLADGWILFGGILGGRWAYGGDSPGYWWGQLSFAAGPKVELLTPTGGPDAGFLERFLAAHGAGPHHFNFMVSDISRTLSAVRSLGIEPVGVNLLNAGWKEAFIHPRDAYGVVIQIAQQDRAPSAGSAPADLPAPGPAADFVLVEQHVSDLDGAIRLFGEALGGEVSRQTVTEAGPAAELTWPDGGRLRLVQAVGGAGNGEWKASGIARLEFRPRSPLGAPEREEARLLAGRLGVPLSIG